MNKRHRGRKARLLTTAAGTVKLSRVYFECPAQCDSGYPLDERLGVQGRYSHEAQRLICLAAASWSYEISADRLEELCGLRVGETTVREIAQQRGAAANEWMCSDPAAAREFRDAEGDVEFTTNGTSVNTMEGWREMKVGIFSKRDRGESATVDEWESRSLPKPKTCVAFAAINRSEDFGRRWKAWRKRLGLVDASAISVLADGAKWIWEERLKHMPQSDGVLDIFHAWQHLSDLSKELHDCPEETTRWTDRARSALLKSGWAGVAELLAEGDGERTDSQKQAIRELTNYFSNHVAHVNYAERLHQGQSIGSGQVEGACKNLIGRRLKQTGARWRVRRVNRMAGLCAVMYSKQWKNYWTAK